MLGVECGSSSRSIQLWVSQSDEGVAVCDVSASSLLMPMPDVHAAVDSAVVNVIKVAYAMLLRWHPAGASHGLRMRRQ